MRDGRCFVRTQDEHHCRAVAVSADGYSFIFIQSASFESYSSAFSHSIITVFFATNKFGGKCSVVVWVRAGEERLIFSCCLFKFLPFFSTYLLKSNSLERTSEQIDKDFRSVCFVMFAWCNMDSLVSGDRTWMGSVAVYQVMSEKKINKFTRKKNIHFKIINGVIVPIASSSSSSSS